VLGLSHSGGVRIVKRLEAEGLVTREPDPADRRAVRLHLTEEGEREARRLLAARQAALTPLLAGLGEREGAALERLLERLLASVTGSGEDANRICRLCDPGVCGHPARCPVTQAVAHS
jgi:MarR family transcriptional regulator, negative regulator of the multidrug operon emrRAB